MSGSVVWMSGSVQETLKVCPVVVERSSLMSWTGREVLKDVREWSGGPPTFPEVVERSTLMTRRPFWMSGRPSRMTGSGREALLEVRACSGGIPVYLVVVWRPSCMPESGREVLPDVREWSGGSP